MRAFDKIRGALGKSDETTSGVMTRQRLRAMARRSEKDARSQAKAHAMRSKKPGGAAAVR